MNEKYTSIGLEFWKPDSKLIKELKRKCVACLLIRFDCQVFEKLQKRMKRGIDVRGRTNTPSGFANISEYRAVNVKTAIQKPYKFPTKLLVKQKQSTKTSVNHIYLTYSIISCII